MTFTYMRQLFLLPIAIFLFLSNLTAQLPESMLLEAQQLLAAKNYQASNNILEAFADKYSNRKYDLSLAYYLMSNNFMQLRELDGAYWANEQSLNLRDELQANEEIIENFIRFAEIAMINENHEEALEYLMEASDLPFVDPEIFANVNYKIAQILHLLGRHDEADNYYYITSQILSIEFGEDYEKLIPVYLQQCRLALAMNSYEQAVEFSAKAKPLILNRNLPAEELIKPLKQAMAELSIGLYDSQTSSELMQGLLLNSLYLIR